MLPPTSKSPARTLSPRSANSKAAVAGLMVMMLIVSSCGGESRDTGPFTGAFASYSSFEDCTSQAHEMGYYEADEADAFCEDELEFHAWQLEQEAEQEAWLASTTPDERFLDLLYEMGWSNLDEDETVRYGYAICEEVEDWATTSWSSDPGPAGEWVFYRFQLQDSPESRRIMGDILHSALIWLCPELSGAEEDSSWAAQVWFDFDALSSSLSSQGR